MVSEALVVGNVLSRLIFYDKLACFYSFTGGVEAMRS